MLISVVTDCETVTLETTTSIVGVSIVAHVSALKMTEWEVDSCVHGYHVYEAIWAAALGEQIGCVREPLNAMDRYAVALKKDGTVIGHLPQKISRICSLFIRRRGTIECIVTDTRRYSSDLPQGGLGIPCTLLFSGEKREITKLNSYMQRKFNIEVRSTYIYL